MRRFAMDFAAFLLGAAITAAPACAVIASFAREGQARIIREEALGAVPAASGDQETPTRPRTGEAHTGRKGAAMAPPPGLALSSSGLHIRRGLGEASMARAQGWHFAPQSVKSGCCAVGQEFDSPRLHGGALVSTAGGRPMETAEARGLANQPETNTRRIRVEAGGLTATARDAGSLGHQNQPYLLAGDVGTTGPTIKRGWQSVTAGETALRVLATNAAHLCRVPVALFHALIARESSWRRFVVSSAGAVGPAQVRPYHAGRLLDVADPETNLSIGACLLRRHFDRLKGWGLSDSRAWRMALEAYHGGRYRTRTAEITRRYAADIIRGSAQ